MTAEDSASDADTLEDNVQQVQVEFDFTEKYVEWQRTLQRWKATQRTWKAHSKDIDIADPLGTGAIELVFSNFYYEGWVLLKFRVELHLLMHAFRKDAGDLARLTFSDAQLSYYYNKYFNK